MFGPAALARSRASIDAAVKLIAVWMCVCRHAAALVVAMVDQNDYHAECQSDSNKRL